MDTDTIAIYMTPEGPIEIGPSASAYDLDRAEAYARQHMKSLWDNTGFLMMVAIADARAMQAKPLMFKSVRSA